jgi:hypothetical protein
MFSRQTITIIPSKYLLQKETPLGRIFNPENEFLTHLIYRTNLFIHHIISSTIRTIKLYIILI